MPYPRSFRRTGPGPVLSALAFLLLFFTLAGVFVVLERSAAASPSAPPAPPRVLSHGGHPSPALPQPPAAPLRPLPEPSPLPETPYDYGQPVSEGSAVDLSWFGDAAFIGDSRTEGLLLYTGVRPAGRLACRGLNVHTARTKAFVAAGEARQTALEALESGTYSKIYLMLGINELGWESGQRFYEHYSKLLELVREAQPAAQVYLQTLIPVTAAKSAEGTYTNARVQVYNDLIRTLAREKEVYLLDIWSAFAGGDGALPAGESSDGIHLFPRYYERWLTYLQTHTVSAP